MARWWRGWRKRKQRRRAGSSVETDRQSLERAFRRLGEIAEEIAESGRVFEAVGARRHRWSSDAGAREALTASVNRLLVPGFAAHTLAQEGTTLVRLMGVRLSALRNAYEASGNRRGLDWLGRVAASVSESEPLLRGTLEQTTPYSSLSAKACSVRSSTRRSRPGV